MAEFYTIHPDNPQPRTVNEVVAALKAGKIILYPTDTVYAIGCDLRVKSAIQRVRALKQMANDKPLTFLCDSLSNIADYAHVSDGAYRVIKRLIPGPYTFLLPATKAVPRLVLSPKRRTTGIRVPDAPLCLALVAALKNPIVSTSALSLIDCSRAPKDWTEDWKTDSAHLSKAELFDRMTGQVDVIVDNGRDLTYQVSSILDLTVDFPTLVRQGLGAEAAIAWGVTP
ncbi:MAG: L-threonylcarbamoyladenylate synthase [Cyanobacteria bacterium P01_H01_bin.119]